MYNWIDGRRYSDSKYLPTVNFISKGSISFIRNPFELNNYKRLPIIKEEDGSEDELQAPKNIWKSGLLKKNYAGQKADYSNDSNLKNINILRESKPPSKLPPILSISCLMNPKIKQTQSIWDTNFGKRLIGGKDDGEFKLSATKKIRRSIVKSLSEKFAYYEPPKDIPKIKFVGRQNMKNGGGDKREITEIKNNRKKSKVNNIKQNAKKKLNQGKKCVEKELSGTEIKPFKIPSPEFAETSSKELKGDSSTVSSLAKNQRFLSECIQSILSGHSNDLECEHCNEIFQNTEELCKHNKQHESKKETCLLCEKVFHNPNEFLKHLLTHEGMDKFSCKKCKKYFPSLRKYKQHCQDYHSTPSDVIGVQTQSVEYVKKRLPKFECKRCKLEFDSQKKQEDHRRHHVRMDLAGAYLLSPKFI